MTNPDLPPPGQPNPAGRPNPAGTPDPTPANVDPQAYGRPAEPRPAEPQGHPQSSEAPPPGMTPKGKVRTTRLSALWVGVIIAAIVLIALLIFIAQNSRDVRVHYLGADGTVSLAVALLLSAVAGVLLVAIPGTARIIQLRRALKKNVNRQSSAQHKR